tara:strand:+ start:98 stop:1264 length:1167 start_codon:yes stop_codon:yes gene_type:complete
MKLLFYFFCSFLIFTSGIKSLSKAYSSENKSLNIGLIIPLSGEYEEIGKSVLKSIRMGLNKINNKNIKIFPRDNKADPEETVASAKELQEMGIKIIIGPIFHENLLSLDKMNNLTFLALTNKTNNIPKNVISFGVNAESQLNRIIEFLKKEKLHKTIFLIPKSDFKNEIKNVLNKSNYTFWKIYDYDIDPINLTKQIQQITKYSERKNDLKRRIKILENSDLQIHKQELKELEKMDTIGGVDFDSVIIADFDESLKTVTTSFLYSDVSPNEIKFITFNQWFDETLLKENSTNNIFFPSINKKNFDKFQETFFINYETYPYEIGIIAYDIMGLINYFFIKSKNGIINKNTFYNKIKLQGEMGEFEIKNNSINYSLNFFKVSDKQFEEVK